MGLGGKERERKFRVGRGSTQQSLLDVQYQIDNDGVSHARDAKVKSRPGRRSGTERKPNPYYKGKY